MFGERIVAAVVRRNRHDSARAVSGEYIIGDINRYLALRERVNGITAGENTRYFSIRNTLALCTVLAACQISLHFGFLLLRHYTADILAFRRQDHEGYTEHRVRAGCEDSERRVLTFYGELHLCTF